MSNTPDSNNLNLWCNSQTSLDSKLGSTSVNPSFSRLSFQTEPDLNPCSKYTPFVLNYLLGNTHTQASSSYPGDSNPVRTLANVLGKREVLESSFSQIKSVTNAQKRKSGECYRSRRVRQSPFNLNPLSSFGRFCSHQVKPHRPAHTPRINRLRPNFPGQQPSSSSRQTPIKSLKKRSCGFFEPIERFLVAFFTGDSASREAFSRLTSDHKQVLRPYLSACFGANLDQSGLNFGSISRLAQMSKAKRKDEKTKKIYKLFLAHREREFSQNVSSIRRSLRGALAPKLLANKKVLFYYWLFLPAIRSGRFPEDLVMDIALERARRKSIARLTPANNWRTATITGVNRDVDASFRYLVGQDARLRASFRAFADLENDSRLLELHRAKTASQIRFKVRRWRRKFAECRLQMREFLQVLAAELADAKFKSLWTLGALRDACRFCLQDMVSATLQKKFGVIRDRHYSSSK